MNKMRRAFIEEYLKCWNQTKAARRAGYRHPDVMGARLVKVREIKEIIDRRIKEMVMDADEVLHRIAAMARADVSDFIDDAGVIDFKKVKEQGHLVRKIVHTKGRQSTIELHDPQRALEMLGKHHALFTDKVQLDVSAELKKLMLDLGLTDDDIRSDPLVYGLFIAAGIEVAGVAPDGTDSGEEET